MKKSRYLISIVLLAFACNASAQVTIYKDNFDRGTGTYPTDELNGTKPSPTDTGGYGGTFGATWIAASQWVTDANGAATDPLHPFVPPVTGPVAVATSLGANAFLPFSPISGQIYTLSASLQGTSDQFVALGFSQEDPVSPQFSNPPQAFTGPPEVNAGPFVLLQGSDPQDTSGGSPPSPGDTLTVFGGPAEQNEAGSTIGVQGGTYVITLNTKSTVWTYSVTGPGIMGSIDGNYASTGNPTINFVGFGTYTIDSFESGAIDDFELTAIPEPSTYMLFGLGGLVLLIASRRKVRST